MAGHEIPLQGEARSREFPRPLEGDFQQDSGEMLPSMAACRMPHFSDSPMPSKSPSGSRISRALLGRRLPSIVSRSGGYTAPYHKGAVAHAHSFQSVTAQLLRS